MRSDPHAMKALEEIRDWAAKGEARDMGGRLGLELPDDADFVARSEQTPGVEPEEGNEPEGASVEIDAEGIDQAQLEDLLASLLQGG